MWEIERLTRYGTVAIERWYRETLQLRAQQEKLRKARKEDLAWKNAEKNSTKPADIAQLVALERQGRLDETSPLLYSYHARLAASAAPLIWGIFAMVLASVTRRTLLSTLSVVVAGVTYIACASFIIDGSGTFYPWVPLRYVIWLPNVLFALMSLAVFIAARERRLGEGSG